MSVTVFKTPKTLWDTFESRKVVRREWPRPTAFEHALAKSVVT